MTADSVLDECNAEKKEKERREAFSTPVQDGSSRHLAGGAAARRSVSPGGQRSRRSPSPNCYRRRSPAARVGPAEEGAVGGESRLEVQPPARRPGSPASHRRSRRNDMDDRSTDPSRRSGLVACISQPLCYKSARHWHDGCALANYSTQTTNTDV